MTGQEAADTLRADLLGFMRVSSVTGEEARLAGHLRGRLARTGRPVVLDGSSLLAPPPLDRRPLVVLAGHIDTVPPRGNAGPREEGGTIWGRGAVDMKGGLAVMASLLDDPEVGAAWARVGAIFYAGEEGPADGNDLRRLLDGPATWAREAELAVILEPTDNHIEVGCVGSINIEVVFRGRACHSARPWLGVNAIDTALPWLERIKSFSPREHRRGSYVFRETATVTTLHAGTARNVVPGEIVANLNYRYPPGWDRERGSAEGLRLAEGADEVRIVDHAAAGAVLLDRPLTRAFLDDSGAPSRAKQAWTDVAQFSERGVPALNFGPGDPHLAHRDDERVALRSLVESLAVLRRFLGGNGPFGRPIAAPLSQPNASSREDQA